MTTYTGPAKVDCPLACDVPEGVTLTEVPVPRHAWGDTIVCPNAECDRRRVFLVTEPKGDDHA